jgi:hypothetical protein
LQHRGQSVLGDEEVDEEVDPLPQCGVGRCAARQEGWTGLSAGIDLMSVDGGDQIRSRREVAVDRARADAGSGRDVADRRFDA